MLTFQEVLEKTQQDINNIADEQVRKKAQEQFDLLPKDPAQWTVGSDSLIMEHKNINLFASASKEEIEQHYQKALEAYLKKDWKLDEQQYQQRLKYTNGIDNDIFYKTKIRITPKDTSEDNSEYIEFILDANQKHSHFSVDHFTGLAKNVVKYGKEKKWGEYGESKYCNHRPGVFATQETYSFTNQDENVSLSLPKITDISSTTTVNSYDENLETVVNTSRINSEYFDNKLHTEEKVDEIEKGVVTTTRTEKTEYGDVFYDKSVTTEERNSVLRETKVLSEVFTYGLIPELNKTNDLKTTSEAIAKIDKELEKMDEKKVVRDPIDNMPKYQDEKEPKDNMPKYQGEKDAPKPIELMK